MGEQFKIIEYSLIILFISMGRVFLISYSDIIPDTIYKTERSSNDHTDKGGTGNYPEAYREESPKTEKAPVEQESFEIEEDIEHVDHLIKRTKSAMDFNALSTGPNKFVNKDFNTVREDSSVKEFFGGKTPEINDFPILQKALEEKREILREELTDAKNCARDEQRAKDKEKCEYNDSAKNDSSNNSIGENFEQRPQAGQTSHPSG